ncbi:MAG: bifunctional 2',3'-cyclic-nucleotide 2'-phosphodiesterase/3'-nucleotidase, partial [Pseudomonadota bacterium]
QSGDVHLRILNVTDVHMEIRGYDYFADAETPSGGLARAASLIYQLRQDTPNTLVFDNGDFLQGNPMGDYAAQKLVASPDASHPMIDAMNALGLEAATLGNHEFNFGLDVLFAATKQARFPFVCANLLWPSQDPGAWDTVFPPFVLLDRNIAVIGGGQTSLTVGVLGLLPPQVRHWDRKHLEGKVQTRDILETAKRYVPIMKASGADLIVVLCHSGIEMSDRVQGLENASLHVAGIDGVDAVVSGHSHLLFPSPDFAAFQNADVARGLIHGKPVTMAGFGASHVGRIDMHLRSSGGTWSVQNAAATLDPVPPSGAPVTETERKILSVTAQAHEETLAYIRRPVGETAHRLDTVFAMLEPGSAVQFVASAQDWYMQHALRGTAYEDMPLLSSAAPFKLGGLGGPENFTDVRKGRIQMRNLADIYSFPNVLRALKVDGAALVDWLEFGASMFRQVEQGQRDQWLIDPAFPSYNFDTIFGVRYEIDVSKPPRFDPAGALIHRKSCRIKSLRFQGADVTPDMTFIVATNDYRASGSGSYPGADAGNVVFAAPVAHREMLTKFVQETEDDRVLATPSWCFVPMPGTSVLFNTTPRALTDRERMDRMNVTPVAQDASGFLTCRAEL